MGRAVHGIVSSDHPRPLVAHIGAIRRCEMTATVVPLPTAARRSPTTNEAPTWGYSGTPSWIVRRPLTVILTPNLPAFADR
jgi:hypothetical protein